MSYSIRITRQARDHLRDIKNYISEGLGAPKTARDTILLIKKAIEGLYQMPRRYKLVDEAPWHDLGVHQMRVKNYYVYYWIDEANKIVQIIAVIYVSRDQMTQLVSLDLSDN